MKQSVWKRLLSMLLAAAMLISLNAAPLTAWAAEETAGNTCGENATWTLENGVLTISGTGSTALYEDESTTPWTDVRDSITKLVIESGITGIGDSLVRGCTNLVDVEIADTVTSLGGHVFSGCTSLSQIALPEGITRIGYSAFASTGLTVVNLPSTVTQVEWNVFDGCTALNRVVFTGDAPTFTPDTFVNVTTTVSYPENNATWTSDVLQQYGGNITWEGYTLGAGGGEEDTCVEGEVCHGDSTLGVHICAYNFPDAIMENCVNTGFDTDHDGYLSADEAAAVTNIEWSGYGIQSLEGLHHFPNLQNLNCSQNGLTELDTSGNPELTQLQCDSNQLASLDVTANPELVYIDCGSNQLTELDTGNLTKLEALFCYENNLTALDLSANTVLTTLNCENNELLWLNLDNQSEQEVLNYQGQHHYCEFAYTQQDDVVWVDMTQFVGQENVGRIIPDMEGATYDSATGIMTFSGLPEDFPYNYELLCPAKPGAQMRVVIHYGCEHQWVESGCDRTCSVCGKEEIGVLHSFNRWMIYQLPTATEEGLCRKYCVKCGELNQTVIPAGSSGVVDNSRNNYNMYESWLTDVNAAAETVLTEAERNAAAQSLAWLTLEVESDYSNFEGSVMEQQWHNLENTLEENEWIQATFELKLQKQIGTDDPIQVTDLGGGALSVSMLVEGWPSGDGVVYQAVYADTGSYEVFDAQYDPYTQILTFTTTKLGFHGITVYGAGSGEGSGSDSNQETAPFENACSDSTEESLHICQDNFPDENFRNFIQENYDQDGDGYLTRLEAGMVELHCAGRDIHSLEGLRHFSSLQYLNCENNAITELDLSGNPELQELFASSNPLVAVDLSQNTKLVNLHIGNTTLKQLDVSNNTQLRFLIANQSQLEALDVTMLSQLETLELNDTDITSLDLSQSAALRYLHCWGCKLPTLDLSGLSEECYYDINGQVIYGFYDYTEGANGLTIDMAQFVGADNIGRIDFIDGAEYDPATGIARFEGLREEFWYSYRVSLCNGGETTMEVYIRYGCEHQWIISGCDRTCAACGEEQLGALHQFTRWMIRELPTATTEGSGYRECVNCGQEDQMMIPAGMSGVVDNSRNNDNMFETWLTDVSAAAETVLTEEERNAAAQSLAWLTLEMDGDYSDVDGSIMEQRWYNLESSLEENEWIQITFDLKLHKQMGTDAMVQVTDLGGGELSVSILAGGWPWGNNVVYQAVYVDENGWEAFDANYNHYNGVLTFTTTKLGFFGITMSDGSGSGSNQEADPFVTECPDSTEDSLHICADNFPDENFRMFIQESYDQDGDGYLSRQEAGISEIHCEGRDIHSLAGLQHFSHLWSLFCENNALTALDVSGNPNLGWINCNNNQISQLDVSSLANLEILYCGNNRLTQLDVSSNTNLVDLSCPNNQLTELDVSNNPALMFLGFENNSISYVDISMLTKLESLHCGDNKLTELDLSNKPNLRIVYCFRNELSALDVSASTELMELHFDGNKLTEIDLSNNSKLEHLNCSENKITQLDVSHMTNLVVLRCNRNKLSQLDISSLTKLEVLDCSYNLLETLQVSSNTALKEIHAGYNLLTALDTANCTQLEQLNVDTNMIQSVDLRNNTNLTFLNLRNNELSQVDVTMLPELTEAQFCMNDLTQLDVSKNTKLRQLSFPENEITSIDLSNNPELTWIVAYQTPLTAIDLSAQTKLEWLDVSNTDLTGLDLSSNTALTGLQCGGCQLRTLDLSNQPNLYDCNVSEQWVNLLFRYTETAEGYEVDMTQFVGADNLSRIQSVDNASYDPATGIATFDGYPGEVVYHYDMAMATNPGNTMFIRIRNECDHQWESQNCHWTCSLCGNTREEHTFGPWTVVELPTVTTEGTKEKLCSLCGATWTDMIPVGASGLLATTDECVYDGRLTDPDAAGAVVLTDAEKAELANGALAVLTLNTKEINNTVSKLETILVMNTLENREEIGMYLDIQLYKQLGLNPVEQITSTGDTPVAISITVPEWLRNPAFEYRIIRVVGREVTVLTPDFYNQDSGELSFKTDVFGTFVLAMTRPEEVSGELTNEVFWRINSDGWLCIYGNGAMPDYAGAGDAPWQAYADRITTVQVEGGITHIAFYAFSQFPNLREAYIANTVTSIGEGAFMNSERLGWVSLAEVQEIGASAFRNCVALTDIHIPASVRSIGNWAFSGCTALNFVTFSGNAPSIGENAFAGVTATVSRPDGNESWTEDAMQQYGGTLTWNAGQTEDYINIYADTVTWVEHFEDNYGVYRFVPERSHTYSFQSLSDDIPHGILVDSNENVLAESDGENACFDFSCWLEAGQTYYLGIRTGGWGGGFDMIIRTQHSYHEEVVTEATCTEPGIMRFTCVECGDSYEGEYLADHSFGDDNICTVCGALNGTSGSCGDDLTYILVDGVLTISGSGDMWDYEDGNSPFGCTESIRQVIINEGITCIGYGAFQECYGLTSVSLPSTLTVIEENAFGNCHNLSSVNLPESLTSIGSGAFQACYALTEITLPEGLNHIGSYAFADCGNLTGISIPASVTSIGMSAFRGCSGISGIWVSQDNTGYCNDSYGVLFSKDMTQLLQAPSGLSGTYTVPAGVKMICTHAFDGCVNLNAVIVSEGVEEIQDYAFNNCSLSSITLPNTLTTIGHGAFVASGLREITIPAGVTSIASRAFEHAYSLDRILVDAGNTVYSNDDRGVLFNKEQTRLIAAPCGLSGRYVIPATVTEIDNAAFKYSKVSYVFISNGVATIPSNAFSYCPNLMEIVIPGSVTQIDNYVFEESNKLVQVLFLGDAPNFGYVDEEMGEVWAESFTGVTATVYYPAGNDTWMDAAGQSYGGNLTWVEANLGTCGDSLTWLNVDGGLTIAGSGAMYDYSTESAPWVQHAFTTVVIQDGVSSISNGAFAGCMDMKEVRFLGDAPTFGETAFFNSSATVYYPADNTTWTEDLFQHYGGYMTWESFDTGYATLPLDTQTIASVVENGTALFKFTPAVTDRYFFCSVAGGDTYGVLYDSNLTALIENDDNGSLNFGINYVMEAGQTYYLEARFLSWEAGEITVLLQQIHDCNTEVINEGTCAQVGLIRHTCNYCGYVTEETYYAEHSYGEDDICTVCGEKNPNPSSGAIGDITWSYAEGVLSVRGSGAMPDFDENCAPWQHYMDSAEQIVIGEGITYIGNYAFFNYTGWMLIEVPVSVTGLGVFAFHGLNVPTDVYFRGDAPAAVELSFGTNPGRVYYPNSNTTWTQEFKDLCAGSIVWCPYDNEGRYVSMGGVGEDLIWYIDYEGNLVISGTGPMSNPYAADAPWSYSYNDQIHNIIIEEGVTTIAGLAFFGQYNVTSITIPASIVSIGNHAFDQCTNLNAVYFAGNAPDLQEFAFGGVTATVYYPEGNDTWTEDVMQQYEGNLTWEAYEVGGNEEESDGGDCGNEISWTYANKVLTVSGSGAMPDFDENCAPWQHYMDTVEQIVISEGITYIGSYAFFNYTGWMLIEVPASVTGLGTCAFQAMDGMTPTQVGFHGDAPDMDAYAFGRNPGYVNYPYGNPTWNDAVKEVCGSSIILKPYDHQMQFVGMGAAGHDLIWTVDHDGTLRLEGSGRMEAYFMADMPWCGHNDVIQRVELPEGLENIRGLSFGGIRQLTSITIPSTVTEIADYGIGDCENLESIYFTGDAPSFGENAFVNITATVYYPAGNDTWADVVGSNFGANLTWEAYRVGGPDINWNNNLTWSYEDGLLTISGTGAMPSYEYEANGIVPWYEYVEQIHTVVIEEGVTNVGAYAFYGCTALTAVQLPNSVTSLDKGAFFASGLGSFVIPATVTDVGSHLFVGCNSLTTVTIMGDLKAITESMFFNSSLTDILIHGSLGRIENNAFFGTQLTAIQIPEGVTAIDWAAFNGCSRLESVTLPGTLTTIGENAFFHCTALREINLPESLKTIGGAAFAHCEALTELVIPARVRTIEGSAFWGCGGISEIHFLGTAPAIGQDAFYGLNATVYYPAQKSGWTTDVLQQYGGTLTWRGIIGQGNCGMDVNWILYGDGTLVISGQGGMYNYEDSIDVPWHKYCGSVRNVVLDDGVTCIGSYAFYDCALTEITIPQSVAYIGDHAFANSSLRRIEIPNTVTSIGSHAFALCGGLSAVTLPDNISSINDSLFYSCGALSSITIPASVTSIGSSAFYGSGLTTVEIPAGVNSIGSEAFGNCGKLTGIWVQTGNGAYSSDASGVLFNLEQTVLIQAPGGLTGTYSIPNTVTTVGQYAFSYCTGLTQVEIPTGVTAIGNYGFYQCSGLTEITLPEGLTAIGDYAFAGCTGLTSINVPAAVVQIGTSALRCDNLTGIWVHEDNTAYSSDAYGVLFNKDKTTLLRVPGGMTGSYTIPETVTTVERHAFDGCGRLTSVVVPGNVTTIRDYAFSGCSALEEITFGEGVQTIGQDAFYNCDSLASVNIPASVTHIDVSAFDFCDELMGIWVAEDNANYSSDAYGVLFNKDKTTLLRVPGGMTGSYTIPETVTTIGSHAFYTCHMLTLVKIPESVTAIGAYAFANSGLEDLAIPDSVTDIGTAAFMYCSNLSAVILPQNIISIGSNMFHRCTSLRQITIPGTVGSIGAEAFRDCTALTAVRFQGTAPTAIDKTAFYGVTATAQYPAGDSTWTAAIMADYCGNLTWVSYGYDLTGASVSLGDSLDMHFFVPAAYVGEGCYAKITRTYADGREDHVITVGYEDWDMLNSQLLYVTYGNLAAKEMNDVLTVVICDANGNALSNPWTDSIHDYAMRMLAKDEVITDSELRTVYVDMLNYGAAAQQQFGYDTANLANADLSEEQKGYATASYETQSNLVSGPGRAGTTLSLKNRVLLDLFFKNSVIGTDYSSLYAVVEYTDHYGNIVSRVIRGEDFVAYGSSYAYVAVSGLAVADFRQAVTCTVYDAEDNAIAWVTDSIEGYAHRMRGSLPAMVEAIIKFGTSAYSYFH